MKRLIFGKGKVSEIIKRDGDVILSREECNISSMEEVRGILKKNPSTIILNCAAKTNLEYCQDNKVETFLSNTKGVLNLIKISSDLNIKLVHISSGCLFDGNSSVSDEQSRTTPAVWYTWTKKWGDEIIKNFGYNNYLILRPRQLISIIPHRSNMITKFATMEAIQAIDEPNSITCIEDFGLMIDHLLKINATGVYNCCNSGVTTPYEVALMIKKYINPNLSVTKIPYLELLKKMPNKRVNTILSNDKLINSGFNPRTASEAVEWCVREYKIND